MLSRLAMVSRGVVPKYLAVRPDLDRGIDDDRFSVFCPHTTTNMLSELSEGAPKPPKDEI